MFDGAQSQASHAWVKWTYQPIERRIVDQIVHDVIHGVLYSVHLRSTAGEDCIRQISHDGSFTEAGVDLHGRVTDGEGMDLDVLRKTFQTGHQDQTCALKLLAEIVSDGQGARFNLLVERFARQ